MPDVADKENAFRIAVKLDVPGADESGDDAPTILLQVSYPEAYPDVVPDLDIQPDPNGARHSLLDVFHDKATLLESLQPTLEESIGMPMIFSLHAALKENAEQLIRERIAQQEAIKEAAAAEAEEKENAKFHGTAVTRESFLEWRERFRKEMAEKEAKEVEEKEAEEKKKRGGKSEEKKLTGRELWERGLVGKVDEEEDIDAEDEVATGISKVQVTG